MNTRTKKWALPLGVLLGTAIAVRVMVALGPEAKPEPREAAPRLVRAVPVELGTQLLEVTTHGTVAPRTESELVPEVDGRVAWVSPALVSGGFFEAGDPLLRVDAQDYEVRLAEARATLARARSELDRATKELTRRQSLAERNVASDAQLDDARNAERVARAARDQARAQLERAERDLERTELRAPFDGRVRVERVDVGQFVSRGQSIATLYAIDYAEVRLPIRDEELAFLDLPLWQRNGDTPEKLPQVTLSTRFAGEEQRWRGEIVRTEGEIDPRSRMVHVVARVEDPYGTGEAGDRSPLKVGLFVEARILGRRVEDVAVLPREALRGDDQVFVIDEDDRLAFRQVDVLRKAHDSVVIQSGLREGDLVVTSPIETPVEGMRVRAFESGAPEPAEPAPVAAPTAEGGAA